MGLPTYLRSLIISYLDDRSVTFSSGNRLIDSRMSCSVSQSSVLGPTLWNILYGGLLGLELPAGASTVTFVDDLALLVVNHTKETLEAAANQALSTINSWITSNDMSLSHQKSEAVMLTRKWKYRLLVFYSGVRQVQVKRAIKYLGVMLDAKLTFTAHLRSVLASATNSAKAISRLMPNVSGPSVAKWFLLSSVEPVKLLYATPVWAENEVKFDVNRKAFNKSLRLAAIRITRCYRTVSTAAALALAGIPPGDLLALERLSLRRSRLADPSRHPSSFARRAREDTMREWQSR